ncbi:MAG: LysM peptidoglycan-binding domain-containing protein [Thermodesulfovibrionales bacterium]|nr:LysM peptidoglycan-binding domain-containing protein [Thermodesulfovibrionales bacterium]
MRGILSVLILFIAMGSGSAQDLVEKVEPAQEAAQLEKQRENLIELPDDGFRIYTVQKGDTLWDITHNILKEPFLWPKVWAANPEIKNPDLIYPGQKIKIPLSALRPELVSEEKEIKEEEIESLKQKEKEPEIIEKPVEIAAPPAPEKKEVVSLPQPVFQIMEEKKLEYLIDKNLLIASGYISKNVPDEGSIIGTPQGRTTLGKGDYVYIKTKKESVLGDKFYIIRAESKVRHPDTGELLGYLIEINGIAEVVGTESGMTKAEIKESFKEINIGDRLDRFYLIEPPLRPDIPDIPKIRGTVVAIRHLYTSTGFLYDIVFIDRGSKDGLTQGSLLSIFSKEKPVVPIGTVQVINVKDDTATAVVRKGLKEILVGDRIINE